jgi:biotin carboxylase
MLSFKGKHHRLTITEKETTGAPFFVETAHHQPAEIDNWLKTKIFDLIENSLNALGMENGASHSEVLITKQSNIYVIEIGGRMGGDFIGSDLVVLSTGYDFLKEAIHVALNIEPTPFNINQNKHSGIYYLTPQTRWVENVLKNPDDNIVKYEYLGKAEKRVTNSSDRLAYFIYQNKEKYQPRQI